MNQYANNKTILFLNGEFIKAKEYQSSAYAQSLHYGYSTFEGMRAYATNDGPHIFRAEQHFDRLIKAAQLMGLNFSHSITELVQLAYQLLQKNEFDNAYLRPVIYGGDCMELVPSSTTNLMICTWRWPKYFKEKEVSLLISPSYKRLSPEAFHVDVKIGGHYVNGILATKEAKEKGYGEALLLDQEGYIAQTPGANFFFEKDDVLYTAPKGAIFPGITRQTIMELARDLNIKVEEKLFKPEDLKDIDAAFLTGTATEVTPVMDIDGRTMNKKWEDSLGKELSIMYKRLVSLEYELSVTYF